MGKILKLWNASLFQEGFLGRSLNNLSLPELSKNIGEAIAASSSSSSSNSSSTSSIIDSSSSAVHLISPWTFKTPSNYFQLQKSLNNLKSTST